MTAIERIKEIEESYMKGSGLVEDEETEFLLKAFKVMRDIAIRNVDDELTGPQSKLNLAEKGIDEEFEDRMKG